MSRSTRWQPLLAVLLAANITPQVRAEGCRRCGCEAFCQKVCHLVREERKIEVTCWGCEVEHFCIPGPSKPGCQHREVVCDVGACDAGSLIAQPRKFVWTEWLPGCATVHTRKKLMKRIVTKTIPSYKWVVEDVCRDCQSSLVQVKLEADAVVPPPPRVDGTVKIVPPRTASARPFDDGQNRRAASSTASESAHRGAAAGLSGPQPRGGP